eukprot:6190665-Amphidinium_carterae.1
MEIMTLLDSLPDAAIKEYEIAKEKGLNLAGVAGTLNWLALRSRPDIAWPRAVSRTARLVARDPPLAYHRFRQVDRYLGWTLDLGLKEINRSSTLWTCADASFAPTGESSHEGMALIQGGGSENVLGGNLIHWKSSKDSKQTLVTKSSCEAELLALVSGVETSEIIGLYNSECLKVKNAHEASSDNTACLALLNATHPTFRSRHISVRALLPRHRDKGQSGSTSSSAGDGLEPPTPNLLSDRVGREKPDSEDSEEDAPDPEIKVSTFFGRFEVDFVHKIEPMLLDEHVAAGQRWDNVKSVLLGAYTRQGCGVSKHTKPK